MTRPERIRLVLEELGPAFVKLGQMLSTRPDLIPMEFIEEFCKLQDDVHPFPGNKAKEIVEKELGKSVETIFSSFEEVPRAAASIAQVHRAVTKSGHQVVIKVQRPEIRSTIRSDMEILSNIARLIARRLTKDNVYDPVKIVDEFKHWINEELDFLQEGRNIDRFERHFEDDETVYVHKVFWDLTTTRVMTMKYIDGIHILDLKRLEQSGLDHLIRELDKSTNRPSFSLIIADLIIASSLIMQLNKGSLIFGLPAFGFIGYLIAAILGLWLVIAILISGRL